MTRLVVNSRVGADGILNMAVPVGLAEANHDVQVTIESLSYVSESGPKVKMTQEEWRDFILATAGTWEGEFERPEQWEYERTAKTRIETEDN